MCTKGFVLVMCLLFGLLCSALALAAQVTPEVTPEVMRLMPVLQGAMSRQELMRALGLKDEKHFRQHYQQAAIALGLIEMTIPDKPRSRLQRYRLTEAGQRLVQIQQGHNP